MTAEARSEGNALDEWRKGWPVVLSGAIGYGTGGAIVLLLAGLFIKPMREALGWSAAAVTFAPIVTLLWALCYPFAGAAIDRLGSRRVAIFGSIGLALSVALLALVPISPATLYGVAVIIGIFASMTAVPTYTRGVASWFKKGVGLAFGITLSGSALVSVFATPLTGNMIADHGWRAGFLAMAGIILFVGLPIILAGYRERRSDGAATAARDGDEGAAANVEASGHTAGEALRDVRLWFYLVAFTIACIPLGGFVGHLQPLLAESGFPLQQALSIGVLYALSMSVGKVLGGILLDRIWPFAVAAIITIIAAAGAFGLAHVDSTTPYPLVALMACAIALAQGAEGDFVAFFALRTFGMRAFSTIVGLIGMTSTIGLAAGGMGFSLLFDRNGNYLAACLIGASCLAASAVIVLLAGANERRHPRVQAA